MSRRLAAATAHPLADTRPIAPERTGTPDRSTTVIAPPAQDQRIPPDGLFGAFVTAAHDSDLPSWCGWLAGCWWPDQATWTFGGALADPETVGGLLGTDVELFAMDTTGWDTITSRSVDGQVHHVLWRDGHPVWVTRYGASPGDPEDPVACAVVTLAAAARMSVPAMATLCATPAGSALREYAQSDWWTLAARHLHPELLG